MTQIKTLLPTATLATGLMGLGLLGLAVEPGSIALVALGSAMIMAGRK